MTMYADAVNRLKSQWQAMLNSGKRPIIKLQDASGGWHVFNVDFYQATNKRSYFIAASNGCGGWHRRKEVDMFFDDVSHYLESLCDACQKEINK